MTFGLAPGKLGFKIGDVLVGLQSGTTDTPETISSTQNKLHTLGYAWNPDSLAYEPVTTQGSGAGLEVVVTNAATDEATRVVVASSTVSYIGKAPAGTATNAAAWKIQRVTTTVGGDLTVEWADGNINYDNVWDNRAVLSYS